MYTFTNIIFPADTFTQALGINNTDFIVGFHGATTNVAYTLTLPSSFTSVTPTGATMTQLVGVNNIKMSVGFFVDAAGTTHGFALNSTGTPIVEDEANTAFNQLLGINDKLQEAGYSSLDKTGQTLQLAYLREANGTYTLIDNATHTADLPANVNSQATGVDSAGDVVGFYLPTADTSNGFFLASGSTKPTTLQFPGSTFTQALGINDLGQITGFYNDANGVSHGFIFSNNSWTTVDFPGASATTVNSINNLGHIVGFATVGANTQGFESNLPLAQLTDNTTKVNWQQALSVYTGPVTGLTSEYVNITPDNLNMTTTAQNVFLHSGPGTDALNIAGGGGKNVLDGGTGSNFLTNVPGTVGGNDTDFVDGRNATTDIWSTLVNFHSGDSATVWGVTAQDFKSWGDAQGATGFTGLTTHIPLGGITASLTLVGFTVADTTNGKLSVSFGTDTASNSPFMFVHAN